MEQVVHAGILNNIKFYSRRDHKKKDVSKKKSVGFVTLYAVIFLSLEKPIKIQVESIDTRKYRMV